MRIVVIDGQGGGLGKAVVGRLSGGDEVVAVGTNALATAAMIKAGAAYGATGENAARVNCRNADVIIGALGIGFANAMHGEISPEIARAVSESEAYKILIPVSKCNVHVVGTAALSMAQAMDWMAKELERFRGERNEAGGRRSPSPRDSKE